MLLIKTRFARCTLWKIWLFLNRQGFANFMKLCPDERKYINPTHPDSKNRKHNGKSWSLCLSGNIWWHTNSIRNLYIWEVWDWENGGGLKWIIKICNIYVTVKKFSSAFASISVFGQKQTLKQQYILCCHLLPLQLPSFNPLLRGVRNMKDSSVNDWLTWKRSFHEDYIVFLTRSKVCTKLLLW